MPNARLTRSETDRLLAGVCGGIAAYIGIDSILVRAAFLMLLFASGIGLPMYLIMWLIMPLENHINASVTMEQENFEDIDTTLPDAMNRLSRPGTVGVILVLLGSFFLLSQLGIRTPFLIPVLFIGLGVYWLLQQNR